MNDYQSCVSQPFVRWQTWGWACESHPPVQWSAPVYTPVCDARSECVVVLEIFTSALFVLLLLHVSSLLVHIGGPQNALCCLAGYLFVNVILLAMNMLMYSFWDMLCIRYVEMSACTHTAGVYVCMCSAKTQKRQKKGRLAPKPARDRFIPDTGSRCAIIFMYHKISTTVSHTHTHMHIVQDQKCAMTKWTLDNLFFLCFQRRAK